MAARTHLIAATTHGRFLTDRPEGVGPFPVLMGFHGYGESAAVHLPCLARLDPNHAWLRVSVQGLHRFYGRGSAEVVASWMTREDRAHAIADNGAYAAAVHAAVQRDEPVCAPVVVVGFSQGAAQAYRVALALGSACAGIVALGGDVPPDVAALAGRLPPLLIGRGSRDGWYTAAGLAADVSLLRAAGATWSVCEFDGGHEWGDVFVAAAAQWIAQRRSSQG
jgi:predicted esterase